MNLLPEIRDCLGHFHNRSPFITSKRNSLFERLRHVSGQADYTIRELLIKVTIVKRAPHLLVGGYKIDVRGAARQLGSDVRLLTSDLDNSRVTYQSLQQADHQGGQRNLPEGLFVLLEIKRSADMMAGFAIWSLIPFAKHLPSYFVHVRSRVVSAVDEGGTLRRCVLTQFRCNYSTIRGSRPQQHKH